MVDFRIRAAARIAAARTAREAARSFCGNYLCAEEPDFLVEVTAADISYERAEQARLGLPDTGTSDAYLEIVALLRKISEKLIEYDTLLFHGSCVAVDGVGYLFTAPSGTGKSTHTRLWREMLGDRAVMVNDDKPFLEILEAVVTAWGSPWNGKHNLDTNTGVPLKAICVLERGEENRVRQIPAKEALAELFRQSARPRDPRLIPRYMDLLDALAARVTFYRLRCDMAPDAARVAYEAMTGPAKD